MGSTPYTLFHIVWITKSPWKAQIQSLSFVAGIKYLARHRSSLLKAAKLQLVTHSIDCTSFWYKLISAKGASNPASQDLIGHLYVPLVHYIVGSCYKQESWSTRPSRLGDKVSRWSDYGTVEKNRYLLKFTIVSNCSPTRHALGTNLVDFTYNGANAHGKS